MVFPWISQAFPTRIVCPGAITRGIDGAAGAFEPGLRGVEVDRGAAAGGATGPG